MWSPREWNSSEEIRPIEDGVAIDKNGRTLYLRDLCTLVSWGLFHFLLDCCLFYLHLPLKFLVKTKQNKTQSTESLSLIRIWGLPSVIFPHLCSSWFWAFASLPHLLLPQFTPASSVRSTCFHLGRFHSRLSGSQIC